MKIKLVLALSVIIAVIGLGVLTVVSVFSGTVADFSQCANSSITGVPPGPCDFIGGNVNVQKSSFSDGMAVPQRIYFQNIAATSGNVHSLTLQWEWSKNASGSPAGYGHAYDYLVSWDQAKQLAKLVRGMTMTIGYDGTTTGDDPCEGIQKSSQSYRDCRSMHGLDGGTGYHHIYTMPDVDPFTSSLCSPGLCDPAANMAAFSSIFGPRTITIWAKQPITITNFSFAHTDSGGVTPVTSDAGDTYVTVTMQYTSSSDSVIIETAPRIGEGCASNIPTGLSWGCNMGGASIFSGSPYHFQNPHIDGSTGSMDNQIQVGNSPPTAIMSTQLSATSRTFGQVVTDTLTITGTATVSGTVRFFTCGPTASPKPCLPTDATNTALGTGPINVNPTNSTATSFTIVSPNFSVSSGAGNYCFRVDYVSANTTNQSASAWSTTGECVTYAAPTAVTLTSFGTRDEVSPMSGRIRLVWETGNELNTYGFHLYRSEDAQGPYIRIDPQLIPASGDATGGGKYYFDDSDIVPGRTYFYQLEEAEADGTTVRHKTISVVANGESARGVDGRWLLAVLVGGALVAGVVGRRLTT